MTGGRVVLLGATGFVGAAVLRELAQRPGTVRAVARRTTLVPANPRAEVEVRRGDLAAPGVIADAVADADIVVHCVGHIGGASTWRVADGDPAAEQVNIGVVSKIVEALATQSASGRDPVRVLYVGAASQAGPTENGTLDETTPDHPRGEYDRQKLRAEGLLFDAHRAGSLRAVSLRLPTVYGSAAASTARDKGVVSTMIRRAVGAEPITMWHDGTVRRDLVHVDDVARALVAALDHFDVLAGRHWPIGSGNGHALGDVFRRISALTASATGQPPVEVLAVRPPAHAEAGDFGSVTIDASAFRARTAWEPRVGLEDGLRDTVAAHATTGSIPEDR